MSLDPELFKKLIEIFVTELDEQLQIITNGLLQLEKNHDKKILESMFRSAHNIKGSARSLGLTNIGDIAHNLENIFSALQKKTLNSSLSLIDICLEAIDKMRLAMNAHLNQTPDKCDLQNINQRLLAIVNQPENLKIDNRQKLIKDDKENEIIDTNVSSPSKNIETIRISLEQIGRLSALMEEMQINKIAQEENYLNFIKLYKKIDQLCQLWNKKNLKYKIKSEELINTIQLMNSDSAADIFDDASKIYKKMRNCINEYSTLYNFIQEEIRYLRLVPASNLLCTMPRYVRDLANQLNKKIDFHITGDDIKIDKMILESLKDPIIHLLRNAIDHGIEEESIRKSVGKSDQGKVSIDITEDEGKINILIKDDGCGIDVEKISETAIRKKLITSKEIKLKSKNEILDFIFLPGFSTSEIVTDISGRGVGLDVVKTNILPINGTVTITTEVGKGTDFCLSLPLTLTSELGLIIKSSGQEFVIPLNNVEKILNINKKDIVNVEATQAILLNGYPIPLKSLSKILDIGDANSSLQDNLSIVVIKKYGLSIALLVDEILGEKEIVIKPIKEIKNNFVMGGTIYGNNQVIIVLNVSDLINKGLHLDQDDVISFDHDRKTLKAIPHILVVDDSITTRTLEKNILENKNFQVSVAVNGQEAWDLLQNNNFSLIITDISMPIMDGFTLTERIKKNEKTRDLPVIIVTSLGSDEEKKRGIEVGANAYILKSEFGSKILLDIVNQLVL